MGVITTPVIVAASVVGVVVIIMITIVAMWKKVPQDKALVITGLRKRVITGGGGMVIPMLERTDIISLENMKISVKVSGLTSQGVDIAVEGITILKVKSDIQSILAAMEQFNTGNEKNTISNIANTATEVLEGKLREIISKLTVEEIYKDREKFASSVQEVASADLADMGLEIKAFTIKEINDDNGYLESLGKKQIAEVKKEAEIAQAEANRETQIKVAQADKETKIQIAAMQRDTEIELAEAEKQKEIKKSQAKAESEQAKILADTQIAEYDKEKAVKQLQIEEEKSIRQAKADQAYAIESNKIKQEVIATEMAAQLIQENKNVELAGAKAQVEFTKKEQETKLAEQEALRKEKELIATIQKQADAEAYKIRKQAEADAYRKETDAEAAKIERIKEAEARAAETELQGTAKAKAIEAEGRAKAAAIEAEGLAEAKVIREKAMAEADAMKKKAEAYKEYDEAAITEMIVGKLPEIAQSISKAVAEPLGKIDKITIIDNGTNGANTGATKVAGYASEVLTKIPEVIKSTTGIDMINILNKVTENMAVKNKDMQE